MSPMTHNHLGNVNMETQRTGLPYGLGVCFGPNRIMAAVALDRNDDEIDGGDDSDETMLDDGIIADMVDSSSVVAQDIGITVEIDNLKVVASIKGSRDYHRLYHEVHTHFAESSLDADRFRVKTTYEEPPPHQLQSIFFRQLWHITQEAAKNLGRPVDVSAISLPAYWFDELKDALLKAASHLALTIAPEMLLIYEETARLAYNLGAKRDHGTWFLILVDYNIESLCLTFTEINDLDDPADHPRYPVDGQYRLRHLGEGSRARAPHDPDHYAQIHSSLHHFLYNHVAKKPGNIDKQRDPGLAEFPYTDIKGVVLTGDASIAGMRAMEQVLRCVFNGLPQCARGNIFTHLPPSHVVVLGAARAVRARERSGDVLVDVYPPREIED